MPDLDKVASHALPIDTVNIQSSDIDKVQTLLAYLHLKDMIFLLCAMVGIALASHGLTKFSHWMTHQFPKKRMAILEWVPLVNFTLYLGGTAAAIYLIFDLPHEFALGFMAALLIAIGYSLKDAAQATVSGLLLLLDKPFQVGDHIEFEGQTGEVMTIGLLSTHLRTAEDNTVIISNKKLLEKMVISESHGEQGMVTTIVLHLPKTTDLAQKKQVMESLARASPLVNVQKPITFTIEEDTPMGEMPISFSMKCALKDGRTKEAFKEQFMLELNQMGAT